MSGFPTLTSQASALVEGSVSSVSLTLAALNAIKASQPTLNAFRVVCTKSALADAAVADKRLAAGERLPLLGVPIAIKDDTDLAGTPTAFGTAGAVGSESEDAELVRRLRSAGAVIVGKTNTCELGQWGFTSGLPIGVQLMGPANSEPLLISLAAQLESINDWASETPDPWW